MTKRILFLGALCAFWVVGCGADKSTLVEGDSGARNQMSNGYREVGACMLTSEKICQGVGVNGNPGSHEGPAVAEFKANCEQRDGKFLTTCPAENAFAGCRMIQEGDGINNQVAMVYYKGAVGMEDSAERVKRFCEMVKGEFFTP